MNGVTRPYIHFISSRILKSCFRLMDDIFSPLHQTITTVLHYLDNHLLSTISSLLRIE